jgi:hypothetical protein
MSWLPHEGHSGAGEEFSTRLSNSSPHSEQRYSKIGITPSGGFFPTRGDEPAYRWGVTRYASSDTGSSHSTVPS